MLGLDKLITDFQDEMPHFKQFIIWFQAVLSAIIYVNLQGMLKQLVDIPVLWKKNKVDAVRHIINYNIIDLFNSMTFLYF